MRYICNSCDNTLETSPASRPIEGGIAEETTVKLCANCVEAIHQEAFDEGLRSAERLAQDLASPSLVQLLMGLEQELKRKRGLPQIHFHIGGDNE